MNKLDEILETLRLLQASLDTHGITQFDYRECWGEHLTKAKIELQKMKDAVQQREICLGCKHRVDCRLADSIYEMHGIKSNEMWFFCFQPKEDL